MLDYASAGSTFAFWRKGDQTALAKVGVKPAKKDLQ
jgi:hypothetical protein